MEAASAGGGSVPGSVRAAGASVGSRAPDCWGGSQGLVLGGHREEATSALALRVEDSSARQLKRLKEGPAGPGARWGLWSIRV